jgi:hypothetical protein
MLKKKILSMFMNNRAEKAKAIIFSLFFSFIFGIDKFKINKRKYAEPAMQASTISTAKSLKRIIFPEVRETSKNILVKK